MDKCIARANRCAIDRSRFFPHRPMREVVSMCRQGDCRIGDVFVEFRGVDAVVRDPRERRRDVVVIGRNGVAQRRDANRLLGQAGVRSGHAPTAKRDVDEPGQEGVDRGVDAIVRRGEVVIR